MNVLPFAASDVTRVSGIAGIGRRSGERRAARVTQGGLGVLQCADADTGVAAAVLGGERLRRGLRRPGLRLRGRVVRLARLLEEDR